MKETYENFHWALNLFAVEKLTSQDEKKKK